MRFDELGLLITSGESPGSLGDSCAETSRLALISYVLDRPFMVDKLGLFITDIGILRHPNSPWREGDTSDDQKEPLWYAISSCPSDGHFLPDRYLKVAKPYRFAGLKAFGQALIFKYILVRWNDGFKKFEPMDDSSCDYLNFCAKIFYLHINNAVDTWSKLAMELVPKEKMKAKIEHYYSDNVDANCWVVELWHRAIEEVWK